MNIDLRTKISDILDTYPELEKTLFELSPDFAKLKKPILRRTIAKITSVQQAAKIANISPSLMLLALQKAAGLEVSQSMPISEDFEAEPPPSWFSSDKITSRFDASAIIDSGGSPLADILDIAKKLEASNILEIKTSFRPEPIIDILKSKGFMAWYNEGYTYFYK